MFCNQVDQYKFHVYIILIKFTNLEWMQTYNGRVTRRNLIQREKLFCTTPTRTHIHTMACHQTHHVLVSWNFFGHIAARKASAKLTSRHKEQCRVNSHKPDFAFLLSHRRPFPALDDNHHQFKWTSSVLIDNKFLSHKHMYTLALQTLLDIVLSSCFTGRSKKLLTGLQTKFQVCWSIQKFCLF